jgi:hypothetical protein
MHSDYFNDTIIVLRYSTNSTKGIGGEIVRTYTTYIKVNGSFQNISGGWSQVKNIDAFRKTKKFFCNCVDIIDTDRIQYQDKIYEINNVSNIMNHHLEIDLQIRSTS